MLEKTKFERFIGTIEPFALTVIILAGANLAGWVTFTNNYWVGISTVFCGILLVVTHIVSQMSLQKQYSKKGTVRHSSDKSS
jgi:hypothetical protein